MKPEQQLKIIEDLADIIDGHLQVEPNKSRPAALRISNQVSGMLSEIVRLKKANSEMQRRLQIAYDWKSHFSPKAVVALLPELEKALVAKREVCSVSLSRKGKLDCTIREVILNDDRVLTEDHYWICPWCLCANFRKQGGSDECDLCGAKVETRDRGPEEERMSVHLAPRNVE